MNSWELWNWVGCVEKPHIIHSGRYLAFFGCIHVQSQYKRLQKVLESPGARLPNFSEWNNKYLEKSWLRKEGNVTITKVLAVRPDLAKIVQIVHISRYVESPETDWHRTVNACYNHCADNWTLKHMHWQSKCQCMNCCTTHYSCENTVEVNTEVDWESQAVSRIHPWVAQEFNTLWLTAYLHNAVSIYDCQICHGTLRTIPQLDLLNVK